MNSDEKIISEQLLNKYFGDSIYFDRTVQFYSNFLQNADDLQEFLEKVFSYEKIKDINIPRLMINRIERFANLLEDVKGKIEVKIFFLITAIESLYSLSENKLSDNKRRILNDFIENYIGSVDQNRLINGIKYSAADREYSFQQDGRMNLSDIADLLTELRNKMAHEGTYGYFSFPRDGVPVLNVLNLYVGNEFSEARAKIERLKKRKGITVNLDRYKNRKIYQRVYEISITYNELRKIMVRGMINYTEQYINVYP